MIRSFASFPIADFKQTKLQMLNWANRFNICCLLDNHQYNFFASEFECLLAAGTMESIKVNSGTAFNQLGSFIYNYRDWIFGHLGYDLKNEIEGLQSLNYDGIQFPDLFFFVPRFLVLLKETELSIGTCENDHEAIFQQIQSTELSNVEAGQQPPVIRSRLKREEYISILKKLKEHILRGDCYEINYCQEFFAEDVSIDPFQTYLSLSRVSPNPFSAFYKLDDKFLICASPERYLKKKDRTIFSQPIKGTWHRDLVDNHEDEKNKLKLHQSAKDRSENVMVVDLVRNDLSKVCEEGSIKVEELFGIYSFPQVHQMISTVSGYLRPEIGITDIFHATFPMGSMTGAPKRKVLELIEEYERTRRGLFSGALGYISPSGDFDFNVVIRSILYNASSNYLSFQAGSGITFYSDPEKEYDECLLKAAAIKKVLAALPNPMAG